MSTLLPLMPFVTQAIATSYAKPYDVLTHAQAQQHVTTHPQSIINITRPDVWVSENTPLTKTELVNRLNRLKQSSFNRCEQPQLFAYYIEHSQHTKMMGLYCLVDVRKIGVHEITRQAKVDERKHISQALHCQISPIMLFVETAAQLQPWLRHISTDTESYPHIEVDGYQHSVLPIAPDAPNIEIFAATTPIYLADGHHRCATQRALWEAFPDSFSPYVLAVVFGGDQLALLGYHRLIQRHTDLSDDTILTHLQSLFTCEVVNHAYLPQVKGEFGCKLGRQWYRLSPKDRATEHNTLLDSQYLQDHVIAPLFNITDLRTDPNIDFIGGQTALTDIETRTAITPEDWVSFTLFPTAVSEIIETTQQKQTLPPKSTYFEPKLLDGFILQDESTILSQCLCR